MLKEKPYCIFKEKILNDTESESDSTVEPCLRRDPQFVCLHPTSRQEFRYCQVTKTSFEQKTPQNSSAT
jgi:hypothetical protein